MRKKILLGSVIMLGGCASFLDKAVQEVAFETPGAQNTVCDIYVGGLRYSVHPPQTLGIYQSNEDMVVDCMAAGNRRRKIYVKPELSDHSAWNMATAGAGYVYDYASKAMFKYPAVITVDFTGMPTIDEALPAHNNPDIRQPEDYDLEEFSPGSPRLNSDKNRVETRLLRRGEDPYGWGDDNGGYNYNDSFSESPASDKGDLIDAAPSGYGQDDKASAAYPSIPGE